MKLNRQFFLYIYPCLISALIMVLIFALVAVFKIQLPILIWILVFVSISIALHFAYKFIYSNYIYANLHKIYRDILKLKNPLEPIKLFDDSKYEITSEINKLLLDWSIESNEKMDQMKQVETYRREFLSNVSHELKTPIFSCQGYIHTLIDGGIEDEHVNSLYLNKASKSIDRLIGIVDDLESISRLESGALELELRIFDLIDLAKDVIESLELQAKEKNIAISIVNSTDKHIFVQADRDLIRQVFVNLIVNSIKYGNKNGSSKIDFVDGGDKIIVDIIDDGIGISKYHLPRLFERFYRVDKSRSRDQGGTGLGLAIVKHIIEAHQQFISVQSVVDQGTTFSFSVKKSKE